MIRLIYPRQWPIWLVASTHRGEDEIVLDAFQSLLQQHPSYVMQIIKSISAREFFRRYLKIKQHYFLGGKLWTQSYFVEMIGNATEEVIRAYVQNQLTEYEKREARSEQLGLC